MKVCLQVYEDVNKKAYFVDIWFLLFLEKGIVSGGNYRLETIGSDRMDKKFWRKRGRRDIFMVKYTVQWAYIRKGRTGTLIIT